MTRLRRSSLVVALGLLACALIGATSGLDMAAVRTDLERALPHEEIDRLFTPLVFRAPSPTVPAAAIQERVDGVVLIASTKAIGTGVLVSGEGDIVTNDHVVEAAHHTQGHDWVAVWFKPRVGERASPAAFLIGRVIHRRTQHDLAHIRVEKAVLPASAKVVPLVPPTPAAGNGVSAGQDVFTIGHPGTALWAFGQGKVAQIRPDYRWTYGKGDTRSATAIQTSAPVNPGDSGGPLLNTSGRIVGIVVGSAAPVPGVYYAVSVQHVHQLLRP